MRYNQPPSYEGRGEALETLNSLQQGFQGLSAATFMKQFSSGTNTRAIECAAEYMHQSDMFVSRLAEAVNRGSVAVYRTLPQVDAHVGSSMSHELFLPHQEEHMPYRIFVEHTDFPFGKNIWYYNQHILVRHGFMRLRISTYHHVVRDASSGGIILDDTKLDMGYESFSLRAHVTATDCRTDADLPVRQGKPDVRFGFVQQEQVWPDAVIAEPRAVVATAFRTACRKLQEVSALLQVPPA